ncbi:MAG: hypothetical protein IPN67_03980 [Bacteroidales bacterium]|nr:hypothetical protein [Bacteroidales bacterium]
MKVFSLEDLFYSFRKGALPTVLMLLFVISVNGQSLKLFEPVSSKNQE